MFGPELCPDCTKLLSGNKVEPVKDAPVGTMNKAVTSEEFKFQQVRDYIMANPKSTVAQIAEVNDITPAKLFEWIREDRLEFSDDSEHAWFTCELCGAKIRSGRLCARCKTRS